MSFFVGIHPLKAIFSKCSIMQHLKAYIKAWVEEGINCEINSGNCLECQSSGSVPYCVTCCIKRWSYLPFVLFSHQFTICDLKYTTTSRNWCRFPFCKDGRGIPLSLCTSLRVQCFLFNQVSTILSCKVHWYSSNSDISSCKKYYFAWFNANMFYHCISSMPCNEMGSQIDSVGLFWFETQTYQCRK